MYSVYVKVSMWGWLIKPLIAGSTTKYCWVDGAGSTTEYYWALPSRHWVKHSALFSKRCRVRIHRSLCKVFFSATNLCCRCKYIILGSHRSCYTMVSKDSIFKVLIYNCRVNTELIRHVRTRPFCLTPTPCKARGSRRNNYIKMEPYQRSPQSLIDRRTLYMEIGCRCKRQSYYPWLTDSQYGFIVIAGLHP